MRVQGSAGTVLSVVPDSQFEQTYSEVNLR